MKNNICMITGASGFIGKNLCRLFENKNIPFRPVFRKPTDAHPADHTLILDIHEHTDWKKSLHGVNVIVHLAARVHIIQERSKDPLATFISVNVNGTLNLANQAAAAGVKRFIFLSSIKANGEETFDQPYHHTVPPTPIDPYGITKLDAEKGLLEISKRTGMEVVIIRPPLVYGKEAGGNFSRLRKLAARGWPLPLGAIDNKRSLIGIENLCDCIRVCLDHPNAPKFPLLVSDNHDISTPGLIRLLATSTGKSIYLPPVPVFILQLVGKITGRSSEIQRLVSNLQVDCSATMLLLNWTPPVTLEQGITQCTS